MGHRASQSICNTDEVQHREVALALLNFDDIRGTQTRSGGERRLEETLLLSMLTDSRSKERKQYCWIAWLRRECVVTGYYCIPITPGGERITRDRRNKGDVGVQPCKQVGGRNSQGVRKTEQHQHRNVVQAQFDLANIRAAYARAGGKCLLGQVLLFPVLTEGCPKELQRGVLRV